MPDPKNNNKQEVCNRPVTYRPKKLRYLVKILWLSQNIRTLTFKKKIQITIFIFYFQNCGIFFPKIRFRRAKFRSSSAGAHPRQRSPSPGQSSVSKLTNPETPRLLTRGRVRPTNNEEEKPK